MLAWNDAALMIAKHIAKDVDNFVLMMNEKAKTLNMKQTTFHNPSGLDEEDGGNISSSCDMAILTSYVMQNEIFRNIVSTKYYQVNETQVWKNKNKFLFMYENATGGKTGYTKQAKRTLITTSKKGDMEVVVVSLAASDDFNTHVQLHDYAYEFYDVVKVIEKGIYTLKNKKIYIKEPHYQTIEKGSSRVKVNSMLEKKHLIVTSISDPYKNRRKYEVEYE